MSICPQFLCIRPCKDNPQAYSFSPPCMTSFGFKEFVSNIQEEIKVQGLYCHEFKDKDIKNVEHQDLLITIIKIYVKR